MALKTRVYLLLVALGLVALGVDRCYVGTTAPESIEAAEIESDSGSRPDTEVRSPAARKSAPRQLAATATLGIPQLHFPRKLPTFDPDLEMRDIFAPSLPPIALNAVGAPKGQPSDKDATPAAIGREAFEAGHRIEAVMVQERLKIAVIDGRWMREGETLDGCRLAKIEGDFAVFKCQDGDATLSPVGHRKRSPD